LEESRTKLIPVQLAITACIATPLLWGEEFGWRGYLGLLAWVPLGVLCAWIVLSGQLGLDDNGAFR